MTEKENVGAQTDEKWAGAELLKKEDGVRKLLIKAAPEGAPAPQKGNRVRVHYIGSLVDGTVFDSSRKRGAPYSFVLGSKKVIRGWNFSVLSMKVGERAEFRIPPKFAYGKNEVPGLVPADSVLHFDVELLDIDDRTDVSKDQNGQTMLRWIDNKKRRRPETTAEGTGDEDENEEADESNEWLKDNAVVELDMKLFLLTRDDASAEEAGAAFADIADGVVVLDDEMIPMALEAGVRRMKTGERIVLDASFAAIGTAWPSVPLRDYSGANEGNSNDNDDPVLPTPPGWPFKGEEGEGKGDAKPYGVRFEVKLKRMLEPASDNPWDMLPDARIKLADAIKRRGAAYLSTLKNPTLCMRKCGQAVQLMSWRHGEVWDKPKTARFHAARVEAAAYLNEIAALMQEKEHFTAIEKCDKLLEKALAVGPTENQGSFTTEDLLGAEASDSKLVAEVNDWRLKVVEKTNFRRAKALAAVHRWDEAKEMFIGMIKRGEGGKSVRAEYEKLKTAIRNQKEKERKEFKGMFEKLDDLEMNEKKARWQHQNDPQ